MNNFFWLHIKKCGGTSFRNVMSPPYIQTNRFNPLPFIAIPRKEWNDNLNNFRIPLGKYDFKRSLFAKKFLYTPEEWNRMFKFTIVRNPYDRAISSWKYCCKKNYKSIKKTMRHYSFYYFLKSLPDVWEKNSANRHLATHTSPIWPDISDEKGSLILDHISKIENIEEEMKIICKKIGVENRNFGTINKNKNRKEYQKYYNKKTKKMVEKLFKDDIQKLNYEF